MDHNISPGHSPYLLLKYPPPPVISSPILAMDRPEQLRTCTTPPSAWRVNPAGQSIIAPPFGRRYWPSRTRSPVPAASMNSLFAEISLSA